MNTSLLPMAVENPADIKDALAMMKARRASAFIATRVSDGMALDEAIRRTIAEADARGYNFGLIALDAAGNLGVGQTEGVNTMFASHDGANLRTFLEALGRQE